MEEQKEIERKFCVWAPVITTGLDVLSIMRLDQGYVIADKNLELRIRRELGIADERFIMTAKGDGSLSRDSWDQDIPKWVYESLLCKIVGNLIAKQRLVIRSHGRKLELDCFFGALAGLTLLECEFPDNATARGWTLPEWAMDAVEVTDDPVFKNKNMALNPRAAMDAFNAIRKEAVCSR